MFAALKAEMRKLLTVRSTYVMTGLGVLFVLFFAGYIQGWRLTGAELQNPGIFADDIRGALTTLPTLFGAIIAILLMTHEYRYGTIVYTLTAANSRSKVLLAKFITVTLYALFLVALVGILAPLASHLGVALHGNTLVAQTIDYHSLVWRALFSGWSYLMVALLLAVLVRNQIAAIVSLFAIPIVESILSLLLKGNSVYLPFTAQGAILSEPFQGSITPVRAAIVFGAYLFVGWIVAWILFLKRDAN